MSKPIPFGRESAGPTSPDFVPSDQHKLYSVGSRDEQVAEAMRIAKATNQQEQATEGLSKYIERMDNFPNIGTAIDALENMSQFEKERHLQAEKLSKNRKTLLAEFGWA